MSITTGLLLFFLILFIASFFVMSEYVLVRIRPSRLDFLVEEGNPQAKLLKNMTVKLDSYLSATQLGVTITSLALGWLGDPTFKRLFDTLFGNLPIPDAIATILSFVVSFAVLTSIQVIIGELVPKNVALSRTEKMGSAHRKTVEHLVPRDVPTDFCAEQNRQRHFQSDRDENDRRIG